RPPHTRKRLREGNKPVESIPSTNGDRKEDAHLDSTNKRFKTKPKLIEITTAGLEQVKARPRKLLKGTVNYSHSNVVSDEDFSLKCTMNEEERRRLPEITIARAILAREDLRQIPKKAVRALRSRLQVVKKHLDPLLARPINDVFSKLSLNERYELEVLLSYSLNTLFYIYMRTQGTDPQKHVVMKELARVQQYIQKLKKAVGKEEKPNMKVDKEAASRFIKAALTEENSTKRKLEDTESSSSDEEEEEEEEDNTKSKGRKMDVFSKSAPSKKKKKQA
ncbi:Nuclear nucleic acid-binding protein C1D, partial [Choanephora cucurbitarum]